MVLWTHGFFVECAVFLYAASLLVAGTVGAPSYRPFAVPLGAVAFDLSSFAGRTQQSTIALRWGLDASVFFASARVVPPILLGLSRLRHRQERGKGAVRTGSHRPAGSGGG